MICILPMMQHEVRELIAGPKYCTHEIGWSFILVAIMSLLFLCKIVQFAPNEF